MNIVVDSNIPALASVLRMSGAVVRVHDGRTLQPADLADSTALFVRSVTKVTKALLHESRTRFVATATSGIDHIDTEYLSQKDIDFAAAKGCNAQAVAEYVLYGILLYAHTIQRDIQTLRIGVVGYGECGKRVVRLLCSLGVKSVEVYDPYLQAQGAVLPLGCTWRLLHELVRESDVLTNHIPLTQETQKIISHELLATVPIGALILHASRGGIIDEEALLYYVRERRYSAIIDVWKSEPMIHPELALSSLLSTPHIAGYTQEGKLRWAIMVLDAFIQWIQNHGITDIDIAVLQEQSELLKQNRILQNKYSVGGRGIIDSQEIFHLLCSARPLKEDDALLKSIVKHTDADICRVFDERRKRYPESAEVFVDEG